MSNKEIALNFLKLTAAGKIDEAYEKYVDPGFKHHNQYFKGDRKSLLEAMKDSAIKMPNKKFETKSAVEEGDLVACYSQVKTETVDIAVFHLVKIKNSLIVEMWDVGQLISKDSPNENGLF